MPRRVPDVSKVGRVVGFRPTKTLEQVLSDVIDYQREGAAPGDPTRPSPSPGPSASGD